MRLRLLAATLGVALFGARACAQPPAGPQRPTLLVFFTIDQGTPVYFTRYGAQLSGGLRRLWDGGAVFTDAHQDHGTTETAPGHASVMSGRFPSHTGIVRNNAGVQDPQAPLIGAPKGEPASPFRFRGSVLTDWMRIADPRTRALSVSRKDRGAILPMGRAHQSVFWYGYNGTFTTSTYYADTLPTWVRQFNARGGGPLKRFAGQAWTLLLPPNAYPEPDSVPVENGGRAYTFPHVFPTDSAAEAGELANYPWMDQLTLDLALEGVQQLKLGTGPQTDVLAVSLSATDAVGHRYGMDSREMHDHILRLDRALGTFLDSLYRLRDPSRVVVALTADHGVARLPELAASDGGDAPRRVTLDAVFDTLDAWLAARRVPRGSVELEDGALFVDRKALAAARVSEDTVVERFAHAALAVRGVQRVDRTAALARADTVRDAVARRWLHMLPPEYPVPAVVTLTPGSVWGTRTAAEHGSPHDYDAHVPLLLVGAPFRPGHVAARVRVVDLAPTLARVLGVTPAERLDGRVLAEALR